METIIRYPNTGINTIMARLNTYLNMSDYYKAIKIIKNIPSPYKKRFNFPIKYRGNKACGECDATGNEFHKLGCQVAIEMI